MYKTSKWIPIIVLFLILMLCGLLLFTTLGEQAHANGGDGTGSTSSSTSSSSEPTTSSDTSSSGASSTSSDATTSSSPTGSSPTNEPTPDAPPAIDLTAKLPLYDKSGAQIAEVTIEEYLYGALLGSISFTYEPTALATQAIALRTAVYAKIAQGGSLSTETFGYTDHAALLPVWGTDFADTIWARAKNAVDQTKGQVLMRNGALYTFDLAGEQGVLLCETDIGKLAKEKTIAELLAIYYPSATLLQDF